MALATIALAGCGKSRETDAQRNMSANDNLSIAELNDFQNRMHYNRRSLPADYAVRLDCSYATGRGPITNTIYLVERAPADAPDGQPLYALTTDESGFISLSDSNKEVRVQNLPWPHFSAQAGSVDTGMLRFESDPQIKDTVRYRETWRATDIKATGEMDGSCRLFQDKRALTQGSGK